MSTKKRSIVFVSDHAPNRKAASSAIFFRHLKGLSDNGWEVSLLLTDTERDRYEGDPAWVVKFLPSRSVLLPPYRPVPILESLRFKSLYYYSKSFLAQLNPSIILGYLRGDYFSRFAAYLSRKTGIPLAYLYHDATELFPDYLVDQQKRKRFLKNRDIMLKNSSMVLAVSENMIVPTRGRDKFRILYPMPEEYNLNECREWRLADQLKPRIVHAGTVYDQTIEPLIKVARVLERLNGTLELLTYSEDAAKTVIKHCSNAVHIPLLPAREACDYVARNATATLLAYPEKVDAMPWIRSNFPSKFCQFTACGIPAWVLAPKGSAIHEWGVRNDMKTLMDQYDDNVIQKKIIYLLEKDRWTEHSSQAKSFWEELFNSKVIDEYFRGCMAELLVYHG